MIAPFHLPCSLCLHGWCGWLPAFCLVHWYSALQVTCVLQKLREIDASNRQIQPHPATSSQPHQQLHRQLKASRKSAEKSFEAVLEKICVIVRNSLTVTEIIVRKCTSGNARRLPLMRRAPSRSLNVTARMLARLTFWLHQRNGSSRVACLTAVKSFRPSLQPREATRSS